MFIDFRSFEKHLKENLRLMSASIKALIVEDNPDDAKLLELELASSGFDVESERVDWKRHNKRDQFLRKRQ